MIELLEKKTRVFHVRVRERSQFSALHVSLCVRFASLSLSLSRR